MTRADDPFDLQRFVQAQETQYEVALAEIKSGRKRTHWMWYVFPQLEGLGMSAMSRRYSVKSSTEAAAYLAHPVLGTRLVSCAEAVLGLEGLSATDVFGSPDDLKLRSCATLFAHMSAPASVFHRVLDKYFNGQGDDRTRKLIDERRRQP